MKGELGLQAHSVLGFCTVMLLEAGGICGLQGANRRLSKSPVIAAQLVTEAMTEQLCSPLPIAGAIQSLSGGLAQVPPTTGTPVLCATVLLLYSVGPLLRGIE